MQNFDITIPVGQVFKISANGAFLRYYNGSAAGLDETILVTYNGGSTILKAGQSIKLPMSVSEWLISNYKGQAAIVGVLVIGDGEITDSSVAGSVSVIDGGIARTLSGAGFLGTTSLTAAAGQFPCCQIWNGYGNPTNVILEAFSFSSNVAGFVGVGSSAMINAGTVLQGGNKKIGGALSASKIVASSLAAYPAGTPMLSYTSSANGIVTINLKEPIVIPPYSGLFIASGVAASALAVNFEYYEQ